MSKIRSKAILHEPLLSMQVFLKVFLFEVPVLNILHPLSCRARKIRDRMEIVYTPKHGSWLNIAECELSVLSRQALKKRFVTKEELEKQIQAWTSKRNDCQKGVDWQFSCEDARRKLKKLYPTILT